MARNKKQEGITLVDKIFIFLGVLGLGVGARQIWLSERDRKRTETPTLSENINNGISNGNVTDVNTSESYFIKVGDKNENVRTMQNWILTYERFALPIYGADGEWGNETSKALKSMGLGDVKGFTKKEFDDIADQATRRNLIWMN